MRLEDLGTILSVWAHPDDETFLCAGLMSAAAHAGQRVVCVTATKGEAGSQDHEKWPPEQMGDVRERELLDCLRILGVTEHHWLGHHDGRCIEVPDDEAIPPILALVEDVRPDTILTFGPEGMTDHPDHKQIHRWTTEAARRAGRADALRYATVTQEWRDAYYEDFQRANVFEGDTPPIASREELAIEFELDDALRIRKADAIRAHVSQTAGQFALFGEHRMIEAHAIERFVRPSL